MELSEAFLRAEGAYREALDMIANRAEAKRLSDRMRKLSRDGPYEKLPQEVRDAIEWWRANSYRFPADTAAALDYLSDKHGMLKLGAGPPGYVALQRAGFILLDWLAEQSTPITAMKFGTKRGDPAPKDNRYNLSYAVDFLACQFELLDPSLDRENPKRPHSNLASDAAYRVTQAWRAAHKVG